MALKKVTSGSINISLTERGKIKALDLRFRRLERAKGAWDGNWRLVFFNIPERIRKGRDALRYRLKAAGFYKLQESVFIFPYDCEKEIRDFTKLFKLEKYVRLAVAESVDDSEHIKKIFKLK